jgi:hypothetical protein
MFGGVDENMFSPFTQMAAAKHAPTTMLGGRLTRRCFPSLCSWHCASRVSLRDSFIELSHHLFEAGVYMSCKAYQTPAKPAKPAKPAEPADANPMSRPQKSIAARHGYLQVPSQGTSRSQSRTLQTNDLQKPRMDPWDG